MPARICGSWPAAPTATSRSLKCGDGRMRASIAPLTRTVSPVSRLASYDGITMNRDWKLPDPAALGLGTWDGGATIRKLEIRDVTGRGEFVRIPVKK